MKWYLDCMWVDKRTVHLIATSYGDITKLHWFIVDTRWEFRKIEIGHSSKLVCSTLALCRGEAFQNCVCELPARPLCCASFLNRQRPDTAVDCHNDVSTPASPTPRVPIDEEDAAWVWFLLALYAWSSHWFKTAPISSNDTGLQRSDSWIGTIHTGLMQLSLFGYMPALGDIRLHGNSNRSLRLSHFWVGLLLKRTKLKREKQFSHSKLLLWWMYFCKKKKIFSK